MAPNTGGESPQWYLEVNGKKFGPYTMAQLQELARHHEILPQDKVTSAQMDGRWMSVSDLVQNPQAQPVAVATSPATALPPRPNAMDRPAAPATPSDPALVHDLFNILQSAKDRKAAAAAQPLGTVSNGAQKPSSGMGLPIFAGAAVLGVIAAVAIYLNKEPQSQPKTPTAAAPPASRVAQTIHTGPATAPASVPVATPTMVSIPTARQPIIVSKPSTPNPSQTSAAPTVRIPLHERPANYVPSGAELDREREARENAEREADRARESSYDRDRDDRDRVPDFDRPLSPSAPRIPTHELAQPMTQQQQGNWNQNGYPSNTGGGAIMQPEDQAQPQQPSQYEQPQNARPY